MGRIGLDHLLDALSVTGGGLEQVPVWPQSTALVQQFNGVGSLPVSSWPQHTDLVQEFSGVGVSLPYE